MSTAEISPDNARTARDYDALPYPSFPYAYLHPGRLAALAVLHGLQVAAVETSHVLELGCAAGGNLIPLAAQFPQARFLGVDLSPRQIEDGQRRVMELGLRNIELRQADLSTAAFEPGAFDTIICHGVFSWVPPAVQRSILRICKQSLAPRGLVAVSYNVLPGWHMRRVVRDICLAHAGSAGSPLERAARARQGLLDTAHAMNDDTPYAVTLRNEAQRLQGMPLAYIMGEFLAEHNHAFHFRDFNTQADAAGLGYLCEASLSSSTPEYLMPAAAAQLRAIAGDDRLALEEHLDMYCGRRFRRSILIHASQQSEVLYDDMHKRVRQLHFASPIHVASGQDSDKSTTFVDGKGRTVTLKDAMVAAAFRQLAARYPATSSSAQLLSARVTVSRGDEARLARALLRLIGTGRASVSTTPLQATNRHVEAPQVWPLARLEAASGQPWVTGRNHLALPPPALLRRLMPQLDGQRTRAWIAQFLRDAAADPALAATPPTAAGERSDGADLAQSLETTLNYLDRHALLQP